LYASKNTLILCVNKVLNKNKQMARKKKNDDESPDNSPENNDETFGLPEIEYEPLNREETTTRTETTTTTTRDFARPEQERAESHLKEETQQEYMSNYNDEDEESSPWPKILAILAIVALAGVAYWFFGVYQPGRKAAAEKAKLEQEARAEADRKAATESNAETLRLQAEQRKADSLANLNGNQGNIETLSERTRRYYVVIASAVDGDLIMDHAKKLSAQGVSTKIIPPFGKAKFYRLAVAEGDNYRDTQSTADGLKGQYGEAVWVIRY
jgi:hypothetical protein